jgi:hypothetical protein
VSPGKSEGEGTGNDGKAAPGKSALNEGKANAEKGGAKGLSENASENAKAVQSVIEKFNTQREQYLAERKILLEKLKTASAAEKKAITEELREENRAREDEERALAKQIREELKALRGERRTGN